MYNIETETIEHREMASTLDDVWEGFSHTSVPATLTTQLRNLTITSNHFQTQGD